MGGRTVAIWSFNQWCVVGVTLGDAENICKNILINKIFNISFLHVVKSQNTKTASNCFTLTVLYHYYLKRFKISCPNLNTYEKLPRKKVTACWRKRNALLFIKCKYLTIMGTKIFAFLTFHPTRNEIKLFEWNFLIMYASLRNLCKVVAHNKILRTLISALIYKRWNFFYFVI